MMLTKGVRETGGLVIVQRMMGSLQRSGNPFLRLFLRTGIRTLLIFPDLAESEIERVTDACKGH